MSDTELEEKEKNAGQHDKVEGGLEAGEQAALDQIEAGLNDDDNDEDNDEIPYRDEGGGKKSKKNGKLSRRQKIFVGGGATLIIGGGFGLLSVVQGPLQLKHLSEILRKPGRSAVVTAAKRLGLNYRYMRTGSIGETRVGAIGSRIQQNSIRKLADIGITFEESRGIGQVNKTNIDTSKNPRLRDLSSSARRLEISRMLDVPVERVTRVGNFGSTTFQIDHPGGKGIVEIRSVTDNALKQLNDGKIVRATRFRVFTKFYSAPSWFHPFERAKAHAAGSIDDRVARYRAARDAERERRTSRLKSALSEKAKKAKDKINSSLDGKRGAIAGVLIATQTTCLIRNIADAIPAANYGYVVVPAMMEAIDKTSGGDQTASNQDFTLDQIGATIQSFKDEEGKTIWESKALNALANDNGGEGEDIDPQYKQAFTPLSRADVIKKTIGAPSGIAGIVDGTLSDAACSTPGLIFQGIAGIGLTVFSGGTWTVGRVAVTAASIAVTSAAIGFFTQKSIDNFTEDPVKAFSGPLGGHMFAYGARAASNSTERAAGGIEISGSEERISQLEIEADEKLQFQQKSFLARMFDINDHRSLASSVILNSNTDVPSAISGMASLATNIFNVSKIGSELFSTLSPRTYAADEAYDWGFPTYGIPREIAENPKFEDHVDNASRVAALLNGPPVQSEIERIAIQSYIDRAKKCFGVNISKGVDGWDAIPETDVNPAESEYQDANCSNISDENWARIILFVYDTQLLTSVDCYEGEEQSCVQIGFGQNRN